MLAEFGAHRIERASVADAADPADAFEYRSVAVCGGDPSGVVAGGGGRRTRDVDRHRNAGGHDWAAGARVPPHNGDPRAAAAATAARHLRAAFWNADADGAAARIQRVYSTVQYNIVKYSQTIALFCSFAFSFADRSIRSDRSGAAVLQLDGEYRRNGGQTDRNGADALRAVRRPAPAARRRVRCDGDARLRAIHVDLVRRMGRRRRHVLHTRGPPVAARGLHAAARQVRHESAFEKLSTPLHSTCSAPSNRM